MQAIRKWHLFLSCFFAPLLAYFALSGAWQTVRLNDVPKENPSSIRRFFHELSKPHREGTIPGKNPKEEHSLWFNVYSLCMGIGIFVTSLLGVIIALQLPRRRRTALALLILGTLLPLLLLWLRTSSPE